MTRVLVLAAKHYDFEDEKGKRVEGSSLTYLTGDTEQTLERRGMEPMTVSVPTDAFGGLREVPGVYDVEFRHRAGKGGRVTVQAAAVSFVEAAPLTDFFQLTA